MLFEFALANAGWEYMDTMGSIPISSIDCGGDRSLSDLVANLITTKRDVVDWEVVGAMYRRLSSPYS
jgi:hypothetical protein